MLPVHRKEWRRPAADAIPLICPKNDVQRTGRRTVRRQDLNVSTDSRPNFAISSPISRACASDRLP